MHGIPRQKTDVVEQATIQEVATDDARAQALLKARGPLPEHIAVIMDGNGRWAKGKGRPRVLGHREGVKAVRDTTEACAELGVPYLTLYTFSTENWNRPRNEVNALMELLIRTLRRETKTLLDNDIRLQAVGKLDLLPSACHRELMEAIEATQSGSRMTLTLALSYSGRWDLEQATRAIAEKVQSGELSPEAITADTISNHLVTAGIPDPDLLVRTSGEVRISNFLLWQLAYTEIHISNEYWPAFRRNHLYAAIEDFQNRDRRFGLVKSA